MDATVTGSATHKPLATTMISLAKREELIYKQDQDEPIRLSAHAPARKLLQYVRDESHRFAQHYHHILREKKMFE
jgi:excinuclease ABC subunit C